MRDDRQADAGSSHVRRPARRDSARISALVRSASSSGLRIAELTGSLTARAIVAAIVGIAAVSDHRKSPVRGYAGQRCIKLMLAVVAAIGGVRAIFRAIEL